ncbi:hypothetical protein [Caldimonas sp. KR1-144]|uniref:hypothetical protein n=1 Tax=Caldimonas sp. KR1-144 TaxID=3400911 RepID=UPI003C10A3CC
MNAQGHSPSTAPRWLRRVLVVPLALAPFAAAAQGEPEPPLVWRVQIERRPADDVLEMRWRGDPHQGPGARDEALRQRHFQHLLRFELDRGESISLRPGRGGLRLVYRAEF